MSNEDIRAFCEFIRKHARNRAVERAMDAEQLEAILRHIPTQDGSMGGARLRARRVSRHLKKIAKAEQAIAKAAAALYAQFEQEYEANLRKVGKARGPQPTRFTFGAS
jgi:predicted RNA-binding Zn ribbon-like protein